MTFRSPSAPAANLAGLRLRVRVALAAAVLVIATACDAGPPASEATPGDPQPSSGAAVDGRLSADQPVGDAPDPVAVGGGAALPANESTAQASSPRPGPGAGGLPADEEVTGRRVERWGTERFPYPDGMRGIYLNAWASGSAARSEALIDLARRTEINTFVIDIKDASGYISHRTEVPFARAVGATGELRIRDLPGLLTRLEEAGIYPIARIVIVRDPVLIKARPDLAIQDAGGGVWTDSNNIQWVNPYDRTVWDYHIALAKEVAEMGFPEIQWDYVRFPDAPRADWERAVFPGQNGRSRQQAIRQFLREARTELADLGVLSTADVFGVTTTSASDVGIGQLWEDFIDVVDAALPMVYPSHYWQGSYGFRTPNAYPYEIVHRALLDAVRRSERVAGAGLTRPFLQDFSLGQPPYGAAEVRAQIEATYDAGIREWILWNPGSRYSEAAFEPVGGWTEEPLIRVAGALHPTSRRRAVLDSVAAPAAPAPAPAPASTSQPVDDDTPAGPAPDTLRISGP